MNFKPSAIFFTLVLLALAPFATFAVDLNQRVDFDIPAQPLSSALIAFSHQARIQIVTGNNLDTLTTTGISGSLSIREALAQLLAESGLKYRVAGESSITVGSVEKAVVADMHLAQAEGEKKKESAAADSTAASLPGSEGFSSKGIPEILVKGSRAQFSLNADMKRSRDDIQPYVTLDQETIQSSGARDLGDLLKSRLTMNYSPDIQNFTQVRPGGGSGNSSAIALRGLDSSQTLILIDGRRVVSGSVLGGVVQPDLNAIPLGAIERIEVLPATASGIYGGGAVGGVVNVILRRDYRGVDVGLSYENSFRNDGGSRRIDITAGTNLFDSRTTVLLNASFSDATPIKVGKRSFIDEYRRRNLRRTEEIAGRLPLVNGAATNVMSFDGDLVLRDGTPLNAATTSSPIGYGGVLTDDGAALVQNAGRQNIDMASTAQPRRALADLAGAPTVRAANLTLRHAINDRFEAFVDVATSRNDSYIDFLTPEVFIFLGPDDPGNPFQQNIVVTTPLYTDDVANVTKVGNRRALLGIKGNITRTLAAELDFSVSRYDLLSSTIASGDFKFSPNLEQDARAGIIDIFKDDSRTQVLRQYLLASSLTSPTHSIQRDLSLRIAGPLFQLPAGPLTLTALAEYRKETNAESAALNPTDDGSYSELRHSEQSGSNTGIYLEATIPIVSEQNRIAGLWSVDAQVAGRFDRYRQLPGVFFGESQVAEPNNWQSIDPTFGLRVQPTHDITLRGSYGTGYQPPSLANLIAAPVRPYFPTDLVDPKRGNELVGEVQRASGGNPDLRPEQSVSRSVGVIVTPRFLHQLRVSLDWIKIAKKDNFAVVSFDQDAINNEDTLPGIISRGPAPGALCNPVCPIVGFNSAVVNNSHAETESYDVSMDYTVPTELLGAYEFRATATRMMHNISQLTSLSPGVERAGLATSPYWSGLVSLGWSSGSFGLTWTARYFDSYWLNEAHSVSIISGAADIEAVMYHDVSARYSFDNGGHSRSLSGLEIRGGIKNVFDRAPRYLPFSLYDSWGSPQMRAFYVSVRKPFGGGN